MVCISDLIVLHPLLVEGSQYPGLYSLQSSVSQVTTELASWRSQELSPVVVGGCRLVMMRGGGRPVRPQSWRDFQWEHSGSVVTGGVTLR